MRTIHRLKVTLRKVGPPVWRRIEVDSDVTLGELSTMLERAMGWLGHHLHIFDIGGVTYGIPDSEGEVDDRDENRYRLGRVLSKVGEEMRWDYDFGDGWEHDVLVEAISLPDRGVEYPRCVTGRGACPPEDCGGPRGYSELLEVLKDPSHPEHETTKEWAPIDFDPAHFDAGEITEAMRRGPIVWEDD